MSKYTTGEIAKLCGVSVRTVQYYDTRGILSPSELSEGGRRLYSEDELARMKTICFLRELGLSINSIGELLAEDEPGHVIELLLQQQAQALRGEIAERQSQLERIESLAKGLHGVEHLPVESIGDMALNMERKNKLRKIRTTMFAVGIPCNIIEIGTLVLGIMKGIWWPFALGMCIAVAVGVWISRYYYRNISYICPQCHHVFRPRFREVFFAVHTPTTRKLTCPECGHRGYCVETAE